MKARLSRKRPARRWPAPLPNMESRRQIRHKRIRAKVSGRPERPRLSVFRSSKHLEVQVVDDVSQRTLLGRKDLDLKKGNKATRAALLGKTLARELLAQGYKKVKFDRGGYRYHGRIKALAEALRKGGVEF